MDFKTAVKTCLRKYAVVEGRASRSEYWYFTLFNVLPFILAQIMIPFTGGLLGPVFVLVFLALVLPSITVSVRRLHDLDKSGWWLLLIFVPLVGGLILLYWQVQRGTSGANRFGEDPLAVCVPPGAVAAA